MWDVGQQTPVHSHETWGVVGIYSGIEGETRYVKPRVDGEPLVLVDRHGQHIATFPAQGADRTHWTTLLPAKLCRSRQ